MSGMNRQVPIRFTLNEFLESDGYRDNKFEDAGDDSSLNTNKRPEDRHRVCARILC